MICEQHAAPLRRFRVALPARAIAGVQQQERKQDMNRGACCLVLATVLSWAGVVKADMDIPIGWSPASPQELGVVAIGPVTEKGVSDFNRDTGEGTKTRRSASKWEKQIGRWSTDKITFNIDLSSWPENERRLARAWIGIGGSSANTMTSGLNLTFLQNDLILKQAEYDALNLKDIVRGCDCALADGAPAIKIDSHSNGMEVNYEVWAYVYIPKKSDPCYYPTPPSLQYPEDGRQFTFKNSPNGNGEVSLRWSTARDDGPIRMYQIEFVNESNPEPSTWTQEVPNGQTFYAGQFGPSKFRWRVRAYDADDHFGEWSQSRTFTVGQPGSPARPQTQTSSEPNAWQRYIEQGNQFFVVFDKTARTAADADWAMGTLKGGKTYTVAFGEKGYTCTGYNLGQGGHIVTATYGGVSPSDKTISLWGRRFTFDEQGNVYDKAYGLVGTLRK